MEHRTRDSGFSSPTVEIRNDVARMRVGKGGKLGGEGSARERVSRAWRRIEVPRDEYRGTESSLRRFTNEIQSRFNRIERATGAIRN